MLLPLLIRADASAKIGAGHVMRCLALAQAWQDAGGAAHFLAAELPEGLTARLAAEGMGVHRLDVDPGSRTDAAQVVALAQGLGASWVVEDGYQFGADYQQTIRQAGLRLLAIDDYGHADHYVADLVLNQNIYADASLYPRRESLTRLLLGTRYVLLRREFLNYRGFIRRIPATARKILVTMGGSDPDNVTLSVVEALSLLKDTSLEVKVIIGPANLNVETIKNAMRHAPCVMHCIEHVHRMAELMAWADVAVTGGGTTCWELAFMGVPFLTIVLADNQQKSAEHLEAIGLTRVIDFRNKIGHFDLLSSLTSIIEDYPLRRKWSQKAYSLINGNGVKHLVRLLCKGESLPISSSNENGIEV